MLCILYKLLLFEDIKIHANQTKDGLFDLKNWMFYFFMSINLPSLYVSIFVNVYFLWYGNLQHLYVSFFFITILFF
jgi:hypothetical protein